MAKGTARLPRLRYAGKRVPAAQLLMGAALFIKEILASPSEKERGRTWHNMYSLPNRAHFTPLGEDDAVGRLNIHRYLVVRTTRSIGPSGSGHAVGRS